MLNETRSRANQTLRGMCIFDGFPTKILVGPPDSSLINVDLFRMSIVL